MDTKVVYVIGGIVDKNRYKGVLRDLTLKLCLKEAEKYKIKHARLPIGEHIDMSTRKVLTINHGTHEFNLVVVSILSEYANTNDWAATLIKVIPARKGGAQRRNEGGEDCEHRDAVEVVNEPSRCSIQ